MSENGRKNVPAAKALELRAWGHIVEVGTSHCQVRLQDGRLLRVAIACEYFYELLAGEAVCVSLRPGQEPELLSYLGAAGDF